MMELRLRSGQIVTFDGRVLEVFAREGASDRVHVAQLEVARESSPDGSSLLVLGGKTIRFAREEAPACARLLAAIAESRRSYS